MQIFGRKWFVILLITLFSLVPYAAGACAEEQEENLIFNGSFEQIDPDGFPAGWYTDAWEQTAGYTQYLFPEENESRGRVAEIHNIAGNDARLAQEISVEPDTVYCLSGYIRAEGIENGRGANLSIEGVYAFSESVYDSDGEWQYIEYYGETGPDQYRLTVFARLGGYSGESSGKAWFDELSLRAVNSVPQDVIAARWYIPGYAPGEDTDDTEITNDGPAGPAWPYLLIAGAVWCAVFSLISVYLRGKKNQLSADHRTELAYFLPALGTAFLVRLILSLFIDGYMVDVNCFSSWGNTMAEWGPTLFYPKSGFCDYPPLYTYVLGLNALIIRWFGIADSGWARVVYRFLPSLCDVVFCWIIYEYARKKHTEYIHRICIILILIAMNPAMIINSAAWGQMDSVLCLMLVAVAMFAAEEKWEAALPVYAASVLVKPQALMLGFLGLAYMIICCVRKRNQWWKTFLKMLIGTGIAAGVMIAGILPFGINQPFGWLIDQYRNTLASYPYATVNTANFYYILGGNWSKIEASAHIAAPILLAAGSFVYSAWWFVRNRKLRFPWIESTIATGFAVWFITCAVFSAGWGYVGAAAMAFAFVITISMAIRNGNIRFLPYLGALLFILLYVFGVKMHERYLFPALFLLATAWIMQKDRRILYLFALFSFTVFINEGIVLDNSIRLGSSQGHLLQDTAGLADLLSLVNIAGAVSAVMTGQSLMLGNEAAWENSEPDILRPVQIFRRKNVADYHPDRRLHWSGWDTIILTAVTIIYSVITLTTLGSTKAPQTGWMSSGLDEEIVFDLGEYRNDIRILYFGKVSKHDFALSQSGDGERWSEEVYAQMNEGQCWKWKYVVQSWPDDKGGRKYYDYPQYIIRFQGRYIRLRADQFGLALNEIIFRDADGNPIPASIRSHTGGNEESALYSDPILLIDEPNTLEALPVLTGGSTTQGEAEPSWWNSTYFDEIYHARTGYEFTKGSVPYETSHPPLGKVLISWCIRLFGMTPFGWRFAGAFAGILMLPGMYLLAKQLTKKTPVAALVCTLMALDCMHLTQTQIATIDSFPVLFIIFAFFFMLRYMQTDIVRSPIRHSFVPLGLSGMFMGLSIASKWIGIYAGAGLAVLFILHGIQQISVSIKARNKILSGNVSDEEETVLGCYVHGQYNRITPVIIRLTIICFWCVIAFVIVPIAIYLLSYIPYMAYNTQIRSFGDYLTAVWKSQEGMFNYHSTPGLGMDHPFYSPWYEWPVIGKPMYYASEMYMPAEPSYHYSIFSFGNPVIWWSALAAVAFCVYCWIHSHHYRVVNEIPTENTAEPGAYPLSWHLSTRTWGISFTFVLVGLLAQYLPWVLVPRGTYIYHYFASIPFLITGIGLCMDLGGKKTLLIRKISGFVIIGLALMAFLVFFPYMTGIGVWGWWLDIGKKILHVYY